MGPGFFEIIHMKSTGVLFPSGTTLSKLFMGIFWKLELYVEGLRLFLWVILLEKAKRITNIIADRKFKDNLAKLAIQKKKLILIEMHKFAQSSQLHQSQA